MNNISLTGNSVRDVTLRYTNEGKAIGTSAIAVRRKFKNQKGEYEADFINFKAFGKTAELMADYVRKGDRFGISGTLQIDQVDKPDGTRSYYTNVLVNDFDFPEKTRQGDAAAPAPRSQQTQQQRPNDYQAPPSEGDPFAGEGLTDDDLPF